MVPSVIVSRFTGGKRMKKPLSFPGAAAHTGAKQQSKHIVKCVAQFGQPPKVGGKKDDLRVLDANATGGTDEPEPSGDRARGLACADGPALRPRLHRPLDCGDSCLWARCRAHLAAPL